jgi:outer membrane immunogenic protein
MKKITTVAVTIAAFGFVNAASAADMPVKAPMAAPLAPPLYNWTGFYIGINGGGAWAKESWADNTIGAGGGIVGLSPSGGVFGGQLGYRYQWNQIVFGIEGTLDWADLTNSATNPTYTVELKVRSLYTVTGQVGWAGIDRALLYVKGGWAGAATRATVNINGIIDTASNSQTNNGWTVGGGVDYAVWQNWILGVEYDHFDLNYGAFSAPFSLGGTPWFVTSPSRLRIDQVVGRLSYKFWTP